MILFAQLWKDELFGDYSRIKLSYLSEISIENIHRALL
jgi:hypothetical protein